MGRVLSPDPQGEGAGTLCPDSAPLSLRLAGPDLYPAQENCNFKYSKLLNLKGSRETTNLWPVWPDVQAAWGPPSLQLVSEVSAVYLGTVSSHLWGPH